MAKDWNEGHVNGIGSSQNNFCIYKCLADSTELECDRFSKEHFATAITQQLSQLIYVVIIYLFFFKTFSPPVGSEPSTI